MKLFFLNLWIGILLLFVRKYYYMDSREIIVTKTCPIYKYISIGSASCQTCDNCIDNGYGWIKCTKL